MVMFNSKLLVYQRVLINPFLIIKASDFRSSASWNPSGRHSRRRRERRIEKTRSMGIFVVLLCYIIYLYIYTDIHMFYIVYVIILYIGVWLYVCIFMLYICIILSYIYIFIYYTDAVDNRTMGYVTTRVSLSFYGVLSVISRYTVPIWPWYAMIYRESKTPTDTKKSTWSGRLTNIDLLLQSMSHGKARKQVCEWINL